MGANFSTVKRINPDTLYESVQYAFSHASVVPSGGRLIECAGQTSWDSEGKLVGDGDLVAQTKQALANLKLVMDAVGATPENVVRIRTYVLNHSPDKLGPVNEQLLAFYGEGVPAPNTFIGVQSLALPEFLIEIEATLWVP